MHKLMMKGDKGLISKAEDLLVLSKFVSKLYVVVQQENIDHTECLMELEKSEEHVCTGEKLSAIMRSLLRTVDQVNALRVNIRPEGQSQGLELQETLKILRETRCGYCRIRSAQMLRCCIWYRPHCRMVTV